MVDYLNLPPKTYWSDTCISRFGRRRLFIVVGSASIAVSAFLIIFAVDMGHSIGDVPDASSTKPRAIGIFIIGYPLLDISNSVVQVHTTFKLYKYMETIIYKIWKQ